LACRKVLNQQPANIAAGYALTYVLGYILTLLFVPFVAPRLMGVNLKDEAAKLETELAGGAAPKSENLSYRKFQARAYRVSNAASRTVKEIENEIGRRTGRANRPRRYRYRAARRRGARSRG